MVKRKDETGGPEHRRDMRERGLEGAEDTREEYTTYRQTDPEAPSDPEAEREAELQPGSAEPPPERDRARRK
jgi:hypothetical protein